MDKLLDIIKLFFKTPETTVVLFLFLLIFGLILLKYFLLRKIGWIEALVTVLFSLLLLVFTPKHAALKALTLIAYLLILGYSIYSLFIAKVKYSSIINNVNDYMKNVHYDYYLFTNTRDKIVDYSESFVELLQTSADKLRKQQGVKVLMNDFGITTINGKPLDQMTAVSFYYEYKSAKNQGIDYQFSFTKDDEEFQGVIHPVVFRKRVLGRSIFISNNRNKILNELQTGLQSAITAIEDDKLQIDLIFNLLDYANLYYDYQDEVIISSSLAVNQYGLPKEIDYPDYLELIHPHDRDRYSQLIATLSSQTLTVIKYRLMVDCTQNGYLEVEEKAILIKKNYGRVSIVSLGKTAPKVTSEPLLQQATGDVSAAYLELQKLLGDE